MPTEPDVPRLSQVVERAAAVADPEGASDGVAQLVTAFEDRDEPVTAVEDVVRELRSAAPEAGAGDVDPALDMTVAVASYLAFRRTELGDDREHLLRLAARAEYPDGPPAAVEDWLAAQGVSA